MATVDTHFNTGVICARLLAVPSLNISKLLSVAGKTETLTYHNTSSLNLFTSFFESSVTLKSTTFNLFTTVLH